MATDEAGKIARLNTFVNLITEQQQVVLNHLINGTEIQPLRLMSANYFSI